MLDHLRCALHFVAQLDDRDATHHGTLNVFDEAQRRRTDLGQVTRYSAKFWFSIAIESRPELLLLRCYVRQRIQTSLAHAERLLRAPLRQQPNCSNRSTSGGANPPIKVSEHSAASMRATRNRATRIPSVPKSCSINRHNLPALYRCLPWLRVSCVSPFGRRIWPLNARISEALWQNCYAIANICATPDRSCKCATGSNTRVGNGGCDRRFILNPMWDSVRILPEPTPTLANQAFPPMREYRGVAQKHIR